MKRFFWIDGRLSWPFVTAVVFCTVSLIGLDLVWRIVVIQFDTLMIFAVVANLVAALILVGLYFRFRGRQPSTPRNAAGRSSKRDAPT